MVTPSSVSARSALHESATALRNYYLLRAGVSIIWVLAAFTIGASNPVISGILLVLYPAWDAFANARDAQANGGFRTNRPQALNVVVSSVVTGAVATTLFIDLHLVLGVFGVWAILSGLLQLSAGIGRWREYGAQWAMVLSGGQSALAGGLFIWRATRLWSRPLRPSPPMRLSAPSTSCCQPSP